MSPIKSYHIKAFAETHGFSVRTARRLIASGEIEAIRIGRRVVISAESAEAWLARQPRVTPASP